MVEVLAIMAVPIVAILGITAVIVVRSLPRTKVSWKASVEVDVKR